MVINIPKHWFAAKTNLNIYDDKKNFNLKHVDLRWTNSCNQACVYCIPALSSKWAQELGVKVKSKKEAMRDVKDFVFEKNLSNFFVIIKSTFKIFK